MNTKRALELVGAERMRVDVALHELTDDVRAEGSLQRQQTGETWGLGTDLEMEGVEMALLVSLRGRAAAVDRAAARIGAGTFGRSIESGGPIPNDRLEAAPLAERTIEEQMTFERGMR